MSYEQFREQCAAVCDKAKKEISPDYIIGEDVRDAGIACCENIAKRIRDLPLPEAKNFGWIQFVDGRQTQNFARDEAELEQMKEICLLFAVGQDVKYVPVFSYVPDAEALRKENEQLRQRVAELEKQAAELLSIVRHYESIHNSGLPSDAEILCKQVGLLEESGVEKLKGGAA